MSVMSFGTSELVTAAGKKKAKKSQRVNASSPVPWSQEGISGERWVPIIKQDRKGNCKSQGLTPQGTRNENSPRKEQAENLTRKTVHQSQMPVVCLYLSWVLCHTPCSSPGFAHGCASEEGHWHQLLTERRQERHEEPLYGGRFEHCQPQTSGLQEQFCQLAFLLLQPCATSAVSTELQRPFLSPPSHTALRAALFRGGTHSTAHKSFLPAEAFRFPPCPAPFHRCTGFVPTTTDHVLISQTPAGSRSIVQ